MKVSGPQHFIDIVTVQFWLYISVIFVVDGYTFF